LRLMDRVTSTPTCSKKGEGVKTGDQAAGSHGGCGICGAGLIVDARGHGWSGSRMTLLPPCPLS